MTLVERPDTVLSVTYKVTVGCGEEGQTSLFITIGYQIVVKEDGVNEVLPFELFLRFGKSGACGMAHAETTAKLISSALRSAKNVESRFAVVQDVVIKQLIDVQCPHPYGFGDNKVKSCADAIAKSFRRFMQERDMYRQMVPAAQ